MKKLIASLLILAMTGPAAAQSAMTMKTPPDAPVITSGTKLFEDFGGKAGLVAIMDDFMINLLADARTRPFFESTDQARVKAQLVDQFCQILNGGCTYQGRSMTEAHRGMAVTESDFFALVEALQKAMDKHKVPFGSQNRLLAALAPQHRVIIAKP
ncbi:MAG TPA: group 1 truncated hemoglobin [Hyphomonadaceae bacterium]